jgi:hypothetical protein
MRVIWMILFWAWSMVGLFLVGGEILVAHNRYALLPR